jgi:hypothetical protein
MTVFSEVTAEVTIPRYFSGGPPTAAESEWDEALAKIREVLKKEWLPMLECLADAAGDRVYEMSCLSVNHMWAWKEGHVT